MDWYREGARWYDRSHSEQGYRLHGPYMTTHLRALLRLTDTSDEWKQASAGFHDRLREINRLSLSEMEAYFDRMRNARFS